MATLITYNKGSYSEIMNMPLIDVVAYYATIYINNENEILAMEQAKNKK